MGVNDRLFWPPAYDAAKIESRQALLSPQLRTLIQRANDALVQDDLPTAQRVLANAMAIASDQPDVLRLYGLLLARLGNSTAAAVNFEAALRAAPDDALTYCQYARVREDDGEIEAALNLRQRAVEHLPDSPLAWNDLGEHLFQHLSPEAALVPLERATRLASGYAPAQLKYGEALVSCGRATEGAVAVRRALASEPAFGAAWLSLADIKTVPVTAAESDQMYALLRDDELDESERTAVEFALARACEEHGRFEQAFGLLVEANARRSREVGGWDAARFETQAKLTLKVFGAEHAVADDSLLGEQVIFILGLPRSGTTLVEQILASHPGVRGAGELGELAQVLTEESMRRQQRFPEWVPAATAQDWQRLGQRYLSLTARHRDGHARFTDKMPNNWQALGAIRAMLPGARIVICRRDPLENCWSCFKQYFPHGWEFTYNMEQLATFWKAFDKAASWWAGRAPAHIREQGYEALTEEPEREIRTLLEFCRLPFDPACLTFHQTRRNVHTLSAAQVRQPMRRHVDIAAAYGSLLDPLRNALGTPIATTARREQG